MAFSRREFLIAGAMAAACAGIPPRVAALTGGKEAGGPPKSPPGFPIPAAAQTDPLYYYSSSTFTPHVGSKFTVRAAHGGAADLNLIRVEVKSASRWRQKQAPSGRESFSLLFGGSGRAQLRQDTYEFEHAALGKFNLLLVFVGKGKRGLRYEAIIDRRHP